MDYLTDPGSSGLISQQRVMRCSGCRWK